MMSEVPLTMSRGLAQFIEVPRIDLIVFEFCGLWFWFAAAASIIAHVEVNGLSAF